MHAHARLLAPCRHCALAYGYARAARVHVATALRARAHAHARVHDRAFVVVRPAHVHANGAPAARHRLDGRIGSPRWRRGGRAVRLVADACVTGSAVVARVALCVAARVAARAKVAGGLRKCANPSAARGMAEGMRAPGWAE